MLEGSLPDVFLDTDVAFDIISKRDPHYDSSIQLLQLAAKDRIRLLIAECSVANLFYLSLDIYKITDAASKLSDFIGACEVVAAGKDGALLALGSHFKDKEGALQYYTALQAGSEYFITRNIRDYKRKRTSLPVYTPADFMKEFAK